MSRYLVRWTNTHEPRCAQWHARGDAVRDWFELVAANYDDAAIYEVHPDGREDRLPSYEEALALLDGATSSDAYIANVSMQLLATMRENDRLRAIESADPLAALEAAERRLLEAGGWTLAEPDVYGGERWSHPTWKGGREARGLALVIERRRLAAKGGA